jgi:acyl-CoA dehydrogenase
VKIVASEELESMAATMRAVLDAKSPPARVAEIADGPDDHDRELWKALASDLGVTGVLVPEQHGGLGLGWRETRVVLAEQGRALACVPFLSSCVVAVTVILSSKDESAAAELLPGIADGGLVVAVALGEEGLLSDPPHSTVEARLVGEAYELRGETRFVSDGASADILLVPARREDGRHAWFVVDPTATGVVRTPMTVVDTTRPQAIVRLDSVTSRLLGQFGEPGDVVGPAVDAGMLGIACEQSAAGSRLLEMTVDYARTRYQFGQPIGSFQAIQHRLADLALLVDASVSAVEYAVWAAADEPSAVREAVSIAGFVCSETLHTAASETIQLHGGIGFTWEHPAHRYFRRALASATQLGKPSQHRERLLRALSI